ncbi:NB-ARC domain-containing protein [Catenuloplanes japonicus]|uniref:NB-ARC domain-containing protein n=1 Tax=Catenuloplanes japonicus TaxID=33876 RepID=UPI0005259C59|nr:NB-ARC domain-containing protein [Catenuloplanes japonicus]
MNATAEDTRFPAAGTTSVPRQLPAAVGDWVGREDLLAALDRFADASGLIGVTGPAGIGKTALAVRWARQVAARFPDGQLFVRLGADDPAGPRDPGDVLAVMLRACGIPDGRLPAGTDDLASLWRGFTAGRRLLVLFDNASGVEQLGPLLPAGPGTLVLFTTRTGHAALARVGARLLAVPPLSDDTAGLLLHQVTGGTTGGSDGIRQMLASCAGWPLALVLTGAALAAEPSHQAVASAAVVPRPRRAPDHDGEDTIIGKALSVAYGALPGPVRACYHVLGLHPGRSAGLPVIAAALGISEADAARHLHQLIRARLAEPLPAGRYRLHDAVRRHAARHTATDAAQHRELLARIHDWYLTVARAAAETAASHRQPHPAPALSFVPGPVRFAAVEEAVQWLETEYDTLLALAREFVARDPRLVWLLTDAMHTLFMYRRRLRDRAQLGDMALECAQAAEDPVWLAQVWLRLGWHDYDIGWIGCAATSFRIAAEWAATIPDDDARFAGVTTAAFGLAAIAGIRGERAPALQLIDGPRGVYLDPGETHREMSATGRPVHPGWRHTAHALINVWSLVTAGCALAVFVQLAQGETLKIGYAVIGRCDGAAVRQIAAREHTAAVLLAAMAAAPTSARAALGVTAAGQLLDVTVLPERLACLAP